MARPVEWLLGAPWRLPLLVALFVALPILVLGEVSASDTRRQLRNEQTSSAAATAARAADEISARSESIGLQLFLAIGAGDLSGVVDSKDPAAIAELLRRSRRYMTSEVGRLLILDRAFNVVATDPPDATEGRPTNLDQAFLLRLARSAVAGELAGFTRVYLSDRPGQPPVFATGTSIFALSREAYNVGDLVAEIDLRRVADWLAAAVAPGDDVYVVDGGGRLVARANAPGQDLLRDLSGDPVVAAAIARRPLPAEAADPLGGGPRFVAGRSVAQLGWYVLAMHPTGAVGAEVEAGLNQLLLSRILLVAILLIGSVVLATATSAVVAQRNENLRLVGEIRETSAQLEIASQHKSAFLANMSHELRTPLNAIIGFSDVLRQGMVGDLSAKQTEYVDDVLESARHLLLLINDILDLSKVEAGRMELDLSRFSLREAVDNGLTMVRERAARAGVAVSATLAENVDEIEADQRKVKQVLFNLLTNAVKFTPGGGHVDVATRRVDAEVHVSVRDSGVGIAPEDQARIFEEFEQVNAPTRTAEGTGLGLALARRFVELHGGRIWLESAPGAGSTFTFSLPALPKQPIPPASAGQ